MATTKNKVYSDPRPVSLEVPHRVPGRGVIEHPREGVRHTLHQVCLHGTKQLPGLMLHRIFLTQEDT